MTTRSTPAALAASILLALPAVLAAQRPAPIAVPPGQAHAATLTAAVTTEPSVTVVVYPSFPPM